MLGRRFNRECPLACAREGSPLAILTDERARDWYRPCRVEAPSNSD